MGNALKALMLAVGVVITVGVIGLALYLFNTSTKTANDSFGDLTKMMSEFDDPAFTPYDESSMTGNDVMDAIEKFYKDTDIDVLVCTKDGFNFVYNLGSNVANVVSLSKLSGMPKTDAVGKLFLTTIETDRATLILAENDRLTSDGYDSTISSSKPGFIKPKGSFMSCIQKDENDEIRRITFVQE